MSERENEVPMTKMYVIFESEFPTSQFPEMRERVERLGAHLARISLTNEQLAIFDFEQGGDSPEVREASEWFTLEQWTNNYLLDYLRVHPSDRPGTWPTRAWRQIARTIEPEYVIKDAKGEVIIHKAGMRSAAEKIRQGEIRDFKGAKSKELLFMFLRNHRDEVSSEQHQS